MTTQRRIVTSQVAQHRLTLDYESGRKMRRLIETQIRDYIVDTIKPEDEDITDWCDLIDWDWDDNQHGEGVGGYKFKRLDNPDAQSMTDRQFKTLCKMANVEDNLTSLYWE